MRRDGRVVEQMRVVLAERREQRRDDPLGDIAAPLPDGQPPLPEADQPRERGPPSTGDARRQHVVACASMLQQSMQ
ncbi:hypothetical protein [Burkholderia oklahomensis]|uniref:hypothetical protein n=1 Tax=Burkholderia oklahomensis TaxID=342113 RepID=UPI0002F9A9BD|nr:hypothetical protein [Burkholderia oklahomensis]MBI0362288.1 hypothetical protein [Burkholderia oklahomensis]